MTERKRGSGFRQKTKVWSGTVDSVQFLGYDCYVQFDFRGKENMSRVSIAPNAELRGKGEEYRKLVQMYVQYFIDLDAKLTEMYAETTLRYFKSGNNKYEYPDYSSAFPSTREWYVG